MTYIRSISRVLLIGLLLSSITGLQAGWQETVASKWNTAYEKLIAGTGHVSEGCKALIKYAQKYKTTSKLVVPVVIGGTCYWLLKDKLHAWGKKYKKPLIVAVGATYAGMVLAAAQADGLLREKVWPHLPEWTKNCLERSAEWAEFGLKKTHEYPFAAIGTGLITTYVLWSLLQQNASNTE